MASLLEVSIPPLRANFEELVEGDHAVLQEWKARVLLTLQSLRSLLSGREVRDLSHEEIASVVANSIPFSGDDFWTSEDSSNTSKEILEYVSPPTLEVVTYVLSHHIKPLFQDTPHPKINPSSGRSVLEAPRGPGPALSGYELDRQRWKTNPGIAMLLTWSVEHLQPGDYQDVWHLIVPPMMSLLDDYQTYFRLQGVDVVTKLIDRVPPGHLKRTGVDGLLISSLRHNTIHLHTSMTPILLRNSVQTLLKVIDRTTAPHSQARFDQLCGLLGDGIIGSVWVYASQEADTIESSLAVLPDVIRALGLGTVRYLKALVPQIVHNLTPPDTQHVSLCLQISSLQVLQVIMEECRPRIYKWRTHIIEGLGRCWVSLMEESSIYQDKQSGALRSALRMTADSLAKVCPSVEDDYKRLLMCDEAMFRGLLFPESSLKHEYYEKPI